MPRAASWRANSAPMPEEAPVTSAQRSASESGLGDWFMELTGREHGSRTRATVKIGRVRCSRSMGQGVESPWPIELGPARC